MTIPTEAAKLCPDCRNVIEAPALICRACMERKARAAAVEAQAAYFPAVIDKRLELYIRRRHRDASGGHIALFNFKHQAYCGEPLATGYPYKSSAPYSDDLKPTLCEKCVKTLDALILASQKRPAGAR